ncbi:hydrogenase nickel incorporation protein HypB [Arabiibacter massiliensis]|uniref:hydrogenase nickel incorporation protein HypB n=1 Tax=Arabiibacter massiliensis TaxID=1870985 RepID=UPI0009BAD48D|nr:hydrogenase nickel incorporation protein HypB [Arabiibacter massiliensis]
MEETRVIEVKRSILAANDEAADAFRDARRQDGTFFVDVMASPGAGKTTLLLALIEHLRAAGEPDVGVIEADLESDVDALKIKEAGVASVELNTKGICHVEMGMVERAWEAFGGADFGYLFLENIGNLVCPAEFDTGAHARVMLLSVPEGWDKVMKYPPMFAVVDALIVTKSDYLPLNPDFDMEALKERARALNPRLEIFVTSARTGEGMEELADWMRARREAALA